MSKYLYTPKDIAIYFSWADFKLSHERKILEDIWQQKEKVLDVPQRKDKAKFIKNVNKELEKIDSIFEESDIDAINKILEDIKSDYTIDNTLDEHSTIEMFFRVIKLKLSYTGGKNYIRMKLRTLLSEFGYKRRSPNFVKDVERTLKGIGLITYLKNYEVCKISDIKLDDVIVIRLK